MSSAHSVWSSYLVISVHNTKKQQFYLSTINHSIKNVQTVAVSSVSLPGVDFFLAGLLCKVPRSLSSKTILFAWSFCNISFQMPVPSCQSSGLPGLIGNPSKDVKINLLNDLVKENLLSLSSNIWISGQMEHKTQKTENTKTIINVR